jgi:hypothetical protein
MNKLDIEKIKLETLCKKQQEIKQEDTKCKTLAMAKNVIHDDTIATSHPSGEKKKMPKQRNSLSSLLRTLPRSRTVDFCNECFLFQEALTSVCEFRQEQNFIRPCSD